MRPPTGTKTYDAVAITLHWLIAILIVSLIPVGWWMSDAIKDPAQRATAAQVYQIHKSFGLTVLVLSLFRLGWRLAHKPPPEPPMPAWQLLAAKATHWAFYFLIIAVPLAGWIYVSTSYSVSFQRFFGLPTIWFGLFEWPHLPFIADQAPETRKSIAGAAMFAHGKMAWVIIVLLGLHIGAALKHYFVDRDGVLTRMLPILKPLNK